MTGLERTNHQNARIALMTKWLSVGCDLASVSDQKQTLAGAITH